jgi:hypothetical protein
MAGRGNAVRMSKASSRLDAPEDSVRHSSRSCLMRGVAFLPYIHRERHRHLSRTGGKVFLGANPRLLDSLKS